MLWDVAASAAFHFILPDDFFYNCRPVLSVSFTLF